LFISSQFELGAAMDAVNAVMRKKHSPAEIEAKLRRAKHMEAQGRRQQDIAKALEISVMTFHRWRKRPPKTIRPSATPLSLTGVIVAPEKKKQSEVEIENSRLRRLVTDLLLEKLRLEDALQAQALRRQRTK
jgi:transposase